MVSCSPISCCVLLYSAVICCAVSLFTILNCGVCSKTPRWLSCTRWVCKTRCFLLDVQQCLAASSTPAVTARARGAACGCQVCLAPISVPCDLPSINSMLQVPKKCATASEACYSWCTSIDPCSSLALSQLSLVRELLRAKLGSIRYAEPASSSY